MAKFSEDVLNNWRYPPSTSEESRLENSEKMVREAISISDELKDLSIKVFGQGSYANDTNVRLNSDIDINVCLNTYIFVGVPDGKKSSDFGYADVDYTFHQYKAAVERALVLKFGRENVNQDDKCIRIKANSNRVEMDVIPTWEYHRHEDNGGKAIGTKFLTSAGFEIINYPVQHIQNGKIKNSETQKRFKRLTRIFKRLRYKMIEEGINVDDKITSFLIECLVWNVPNYIFNDNVTWTERLRKAIVYLYDNTKEDATTCNEWGEVSELLYLFRPNRKWTRGDVNYFMVQSFNYLDFEQ